MSDYLDAAGLADVWGRTKELVKEPVGIIKTSAGADMGEKWLLCNGSSFGAGEYPELANILNPSDGTWVEACLGVNATVNDVYCYNGTWVAVGAYNSYPHAFVSNDPISGWTKVQLDTASYMYVNGITCYDGTWVAVGSKSNSDSYDYPYIYITADPLGTWTGLQIATAKGNLRDIACYNGEWIAVGDDDLTSNWSGWVYKSATADPNGAWYGTKLSGAYLYKVACYNGSWVALGMSSSSYKYAKVFSLDSTGTWNGKELNSVAVETGMGLACHNGTWVACVSVNSSPYAAYAYVTTDPAGDWTENVIYSLDASNYRAHVLDLIYTDGKWMCAGYKNTGSGNSQRPCIYTAADPLGTWERHDLNDNAVSKMRCIGAFGSEQIAFADDYSLYHFGFYSLPIINTEGVYTYIKAKE